MTSRLPHHIAGASLDQEPLEAALRSADGPAVLREQLERFHAWHPSGAAVAVQVAPAGAVGIEVMALAAEAPGGRTLAAVVEAVHHPAGVRGVAVARIFDRAWEVPDIATQVAAALARVRGTAWARHDAATRTAWLVYLLRLRETYGSRGVGLDLAGDGAVAATGSVQLRDARVALAREAYRALVTDPDATLRELGTALQYRPSGEALAPLAGHPNATLPLLSQVLAAPAKEDLRHAARDACAARPECWLDATLVRELQDASWEAIATAMGRAEPLARGAIARAMQLWALPSFSAWLRRAPHPGVLATLDAADCAAGIHHAMHMASPDELALLIDAVAQMPNGAGYAAGLDEIPRVAQRRGMAPHVLNPHLVPRPRS